MDEMDIRLVQRLMMNSRTPYRELADELGISLQAVHRRIQTMMNEGVIKGFNASLSPAYLNAITVDVIGRIDSPLVDEAIEQMGKSEFTNYILLGAGNYALVGSLLRKNSDLESYLQFLRDKGTLHDIWVGLESFGFAGRVRAAEDAENGELTNLDLKIINSLRADARKPVNVIADEIGLSSKTVAKRLDKMVEERKVFLSVRWYPGMTSGVIAYLHIFLEEGADKKAVSMRFIEKFSPRLAFLRSYSNHLDLLGAITWTPTVVEQNELTSALAKVEMVKSVVPYVLLRKFEFQTWADKTVSSSKI